MSGAPLFQAVHKGSPVTVGHACPEELAALAGCPDPAAVRDVLECWSVVAIRFSGDRTEIHALGWQVAERNSWITSPLVSADMDASMVATRSGHAYRLGTQDVAEVAPGLRAHLDYALRTLGSPMSASDASVRSETILSDGQRVGRFVVLRDLDGVTHAVAAGSIGAACATDEGTLLMLPGGRMVHVPKSLEIVLGWLDGRG